MKIILVVEVTDRQRRAMALARDCETTRGGLATRHALLTEFRVLVEAHVEDIEHDAMRKLDREGYDGS